MSVTPLTVDNRPQVNEYVNRTIVNNQAHWLRTLFSPSPWSEEPLLTDSSIPEAGGTDQAAQGKLPEDSLRISEIIAQAKEIAPGTQAADDQPAPT